MTLSMLAVATVLILSVLEPAMIPLQPVMGQMLSMLVMGQIVSMQVQAMMISRAAQAQTTSQRVWVVSRKW